MKFTIKKSDIADVLSKLQGLTSRKSNLAITESVLIRSNDSKISIAATDLETGFEGSYEANIEREGVVALNSKKLFEIVRTFPSDEIYLNEVENRWVKIGNNKVEYNIVGMNPQDFPEIPQIEEIDFFEVQSHDFRKMIEKNAVIGFSGEEKRAHIMGINLEVFENNDGNGIRMVATDGKRLSMVDYPHYEEVLGLSRGQKILIPKKGLWEASKFLNAEGVVKIAVRENQFIIKKDREILIISLLEGDFPEYGDLLETDDETHEIVMDREAFKMMLKRMTILTSDDYKGVIFKFKKGMLFIEAANPDIGESWEEMEIDFSGDPIEVAFNPHFFIDSLNAIEDEQLLLRIRDEGHPCLLQGENDKTYISIIMPMKI